MTQHFDIIVAGAGMVGACTALSLARHGFKIGLIEPSQLAPESLATDAPYDLRVSAISPTSQAVLSALGVWQRLDAQRLCFYEQMSIWHEHGDARIHFDSVELAREYLGVIVENRQIVRALHRACEDEQNIEWFSGEKIVALNENSEQRLSLQLASKISLTADLLIAADGRGSVTRELAGIEKTGGDYQQRAIVANVSTGKSHQSTAWQRFLSTGPLAYLPLANGQSSIVWSCDNTLAEAMLEADDDAFCAALGEAMELQLGDVLSVGERMSFPLGWHSCHQWLKNRVLLIGDAAHGVHPLAGQGVNLGFSDVDLLEKKIGHLSQAWNPKILRQFERQRKSETALATHAFSGLKWIYSIDTWPLNQMRDLGMQMVQANPAGKRLLMQQALRNMA